MELKDKVNLIDELRNLQEVAEFEQSLEEAPLTEEMVAMLPPKVRNANHQYLQKLREYGQLVKAPVPPIEEFVKSATGYVVKQSTVDMMSREQHRQLIREKLIPSDKLTIYPDIDRASEIVVHYNYFIETPNGFSPRSTGQNDMVRVQVVDLDERESQENVGKIRESQLMYEEAKAEMEHLLRNIEPIKEGNMNTQYFVRPESVFV